MPDIFEQYAVDHPTPPAANGGGTGNVFEQYAAANPAPKGNVFDQYATKQQAVPAHSGLNFPMPQDADVAAHAAIGAPLGQDPQLQIQRLRQQEAQQQAYRQFLNTPQGEIVAANAQRGPAESFALTAGRLLPFMGGELEKGVAHGLQYVAPQTAENLYNAGQQAVAVGPNPQYANDLSQVPAQIIGGMLQYADPFVAATMGAAEAGENVRQQIDAGQQISPMQATANIAGHAALNALVGKVFGGENPLGPQLERPIIDQVAPDLLAKAGVKGTTNLAVNQGTTAAGQLLDQQTTNPNQQVGKGALGRAPADILFPALMEGIHGAPAPEVRPDANGATAPAVTQPETPPQAQGAPVVQDIQNSLARIRQHVAGFESKTKELEEQATNPQASLGPFPEQGHGRPVPPLQPHEPLPVKGEGRAPITPPTPEQLAGAKTWAEQLKEKNKANVPYEPPQYMKDILSQETQEESVKGQETTLPANESFFDRIKREAAEKGVGPTPDNALKASKTPEPNEDVRANAQDYAKQAGIDYNPPTDYAKVNPETGKKIADAYEAMKHNPNDPDVKASYDAFKQETANQYQHLVDKGVTFTPSETNPYANSAEMQQDVRDNNHLSYYTGGEAPADHPMSEPVPGMGDTTYNHLFRAVHDYYGHAKEGNGFGARGEENAWRQHSALYSDAARPAMTSETRGQNSWVNFGPHGEANRANPANTTYAEQKAGLLPSEYHGETKAPGAISKFLKDESGGLDVGKTKLALSQAVGEAGSLKNRIVAGAKAAGGELNRALDMHFDSPETKQTRAVVTEALGSPDQNAARLAKALAPIHSVTSSMTDMQTAREMDHFEQTGEFIDPRLQAFAKTIQAANQSVLDDATKYGINTHFFADPAKYLHREFDVEPNTTPGGTGGSAAGRESALRRRKYDTAAQAVEAGHKFSAPLEQMIVKGYGEMQQSVAARKAMYTTEDRNLVTWVPENRSTKGLTPLTDRLAKQDRPVYATKQAAAILQSKGMYERQGYVNRGLAVKENPEFQVYRPGDPKPEGMVPLPEEYNVRGQLHAADPGVANVMNSITPVKHSTLASLAADAAQKVTGAQFIDSLSHVLTIAPSEMQREFGRMVDSIGHREWRDAGQALFDASTGGLARARFGKQIKETLIDPASHPELASLAGEYAKRSGNVGLMSRNNPGRLNAGLGERWESMKDDLRQGRPVAALGHFISHTYGSIHDLMMHNYIDNLRTGSNANRLRQLLERGESGDILNDHMADWKRSTDNIMGNREQFATAANGGLRSVMKSTFPLYQYTEGWLREAGSSLRFRGPALMSIMGGYAGTAALSSAIQLSMTGKAPSSFYDTIAPRVDDKGNRLQIRGFPHIVATLIHDPIRFAFNRLNPMLQSGYNVLQAYRGTNPRTGYPWGKNDDKIKETAQEMLTHITPSVLDSHPDDAEGWLKSVFGIRISQDAATAQFRQKRKTY